MNIKEVLEHPWITKYNQNIVNQRKKSNDLNSDLKFFVSQEN